MHPYLSDDKMLQTYDSSPTSPRNFE